MNPVTGVADEQARQWLAKLHGGRSTAQDRAGFEQWLGAQPAHAIAYRRAEQLWRDLSLANALGEIDINSPSRTHRWISRPVLAVAVSLLAVAVTLSVLWLRPAGEHYATKIAEVRELTLPDGSRVTLGARSSLSMDFDAGRRAVTLTSGEAFFSVVKDPTRPFYVTAGDARVRVLGTDFDVRHGPREIHVAVSSGVVEVTRALEGLGQASAETIDADRHLLKAGQALTASASQFAVRAVGRTEPGAWRRGRFGYDNASLGEVIADVNRYSERQVVFADDALSEVRVTTAFRTDQIEDMLAGLAATHPILVERNGADRIVLRPRP
jgi:transmembrane sensor